MVGSGVNQINTNNCTSDVKNTNTEIISSCATECGSFTETNDDSTCNKASANDGLAENATPDDVLSLIDY